MDYSELPKTGLRYRELAEVFQMNHMTVHKAVKGTASLTERNKKKLEDITPILMKLLAAGTLPMKTEDKDKRATNVAKIRAYVERVLGI